MPRITLGARAGRWILMVGFLCAWPTLAEAEVYKGNMTLTGITNFWFFGKASPGRILCVYRKTITITNGTITLNGNTGKAVFPRVGIGELLGPADPLCKPGSIFNFTAPIVLPLTVNGNEFSYSFSAFPGSTIKLSGTRVGSHVVGTYQEESHDNVQDDDLVAAFDFVDPDPLTIEAPPFAATHVIVGQQENYCFVVKNGAPEKWGGPLVPVPGLTLTKPEPEFLCLAGLPEEEGEYAFTITVTDTLGRTASLDVTYHVFPANDPNKKKWAKRANQAMKTALREAIPGLVDPRDDRVGEAGQAGEALWGAIAVKLAGDPPRHDFDQLAVPVPIVAAAMSGGFALAPYLPELQDLLQTNLDSYALGVALLLSVEREQGAAAAGDSFWRQRQLDLVATFSASLTSLRKHHLSVLELLKAKSANDSLVPVVADEWIDRARVRVRSPEYAADLKFRLQLMGLPVEDVDSILPLIAAAGGPITVPTPLFALLADDARQLEDLLDPRLACDVDKDGDVDVADLQLIRAANGQTAASGDLRDANVDGRINVADVRYCQLRLTPR